MRDVLSTEAAIRVKTNLEWWMKQLPVVSFNGTRYDLQLIKYELTILFADSTLKTHHKKSHKDVQDIGSNGEEEAEEKEMMGFRE